MSVALLIPSLFLLFSFSAAPSVDNSYAALRLYNGVWEVTPAKLEAGKPPDRLEDQCTLIRRYFACQQTVTGKVGALIVFIPADQPGHNYTQAVMPEGWAGGRSELEITDYRIGRLKTHFKK